METILKRQSLYFVEPYRVEVREETMSPPGPGQFLVRSLMSGISAGTEQLVYRGQIPQELALDETINDLEGQFKYPLKYGYAVVGEVTAIGEKVDSGWQGQLVFAFHPHESHFITTPNNVVPLSVASVVEDAIFLPNMETAVNLVMDGRPLIGENVVVFGQGVVGLLTTALLSRFPLNRLITVDSYERRQKESMALGAHVSLGSSIQLATYFQETKESKSVDLIYELSGNPAALDQAIALAGFDSRIIVGSWYGTKPAHLDLGSTFHRQRIRFISSQVSTIAPEFRGRWSKSRRMDVAWHMLQKIQPARLITHRFHLNEAIQAYQLLDQTSELALQVVLSY